MYKLLPLPYQYQDLEPFIDTHTIGVHYHKHLKNYLDKLNKILKSANYNFKYTLPQLLNHINEFDENIRDDLLFNLGGALNHDLYFRSMSMKNDRTSKGELHHKITEKYQSIENLKKELKKQALSLKGSGYTFLVMNKDHSLDIINTKNQETPLSNQLLPLLAIDLWEHAYYLNYKNEKEKYLDNFFLIMDLNYASELYNKFIALSN